MLKDKWTVYFVNAGLLAGFAVRFLVGRRVPAMFAFALAFCLVQLFVVLVNAREKLDVKKRCRA